MGYATFKESPKSLTTSDQIGKGQVKIEHLDPALFAEIQSVQRHNHSGVHSRKVSLRSLEGSFGTAGFFMYSSDGTKKYQITIDSGSGAFVVTEV